MRIGPLRAVHLFCDHLFINTRPTLGPFRNAPVSKLGNGGESASATEEAYPTEDPIDPGQKWLPRRPLPLRTNTARFRQELSQKSHLSVIRHPHRHVQHSFVTFMRCSPRRHRRPVFGVCMTKVVVVEDERDIVEILEFNLKAEGFEVSSATSGREGLTLVENARPDLLIVDLMLPDISGNEICRAVRASSQGKQLPILILSARGEEIDRVVGFELGADDYVTKPFSVRELMLRVRALVRRSQTGAKKQPDESIIFGPLRIDRQAHRIWVNGEEVALTALEFKLLVTLFDRRNRVQTRAGLLEHVWGIHAHISTRTVDAHVKRLREKLGDARNYVETVRGVGYRFKEDPSEDDDSGSDGPVSGDGESPQRQGPLGAAPSLMEPRVSDLF